MKSEEARVAEAVAALTARLDQWGAPDAAIKADEVIKDLIRAGWRPRAPEVYTPPAGSDRLCVDPTPYADQARAAIRANNSWTQGLMEGASEA